LNVGSTFGNCGEGRKENIVHLKCVEALGKLVPGKNAVSIVSCAEAKLIMC